MNKFDIIKIEHPELFKEQICKVCGNSYYLSKKQIYAIVRVFEKGKTNFNCCSVKCSRILQMRTMGALVYRKGIVDKIKISKLKNIDKNGLNSYQRQTIACKRTKQERYGNANYNNLNKILKTSSLADNNGLTSYDYAVLSRKRTNKIKYNDPNYNNWKKAIKTRKNDIDENGLDSYQRSSKKAIETTLKRKGVRHHTQTQEYKDLFKNKERVDKINQKIYETKKKNKSFNNRSKSEIRCYELIKTIFPKAEHTYKDDKRYPFQCDIYILDIDMFIECHFGFAHGGEPFNPNNLKHLKEVEKCNIKKEELRFDGKKKKSYAEKIKVWTIDDPLKLETFKKNNLNYKIFYTEKEFNDWYYKNEFGKNI